MKKISSNRGGIIRTVIFLVALLIILGYFGLNLRNIISSPTVQANLTYAEELALNAWNDYLKNPAEYLWNDIYIPYIWDPAINALKRMKDGSAPISAEQTPKLPNAPASAPSGSSGTSTAPRQ